MAQRFLTKEQMIARFEEIHKEGWIKSLRPLNSGGIGNTIDALLGQPENNLPVADTAQWELKSHRVGSASLLTLFHLEPHPARSSVVSRVLLPKYGWPDQKGRVGEFSFRQTLRTTQPTDRGFGILVDNENATLRVLFDVRLVSEHHRAWLETVRARAGVGRLSPEPYWTHQQVDIQASTKLQNVFYIEAHTRRVNREEFFAIARVQVLQGFEIRQFIGALEQGAVRIDFDARTGHNHGTKFRIQQDWFPSMYRYMETPLGPFAYPG